MYSRNIAIADYKNDAYILSAFKEAREISSSFRVACNVDEKGLSTGKAESISNSKRSAY